MVSKVVQSINNTKERIKSIDFNAHWYRRVFHTFGASFIFYYMLPDLDWINLLKFWVPPALVILAISLEILRLKGILSSEHFFGLRLYEKNRVGSYVFFAVGALLLLRFFPQQIAIPCILCACIGDPVIGEIRRRYNTKLVYILGFLVCLFLFMITWYKANIWLFLIVSVIGAIGAIVGETKKFKLLDDDLMIQLVPAILIGIIWIAIPEVGLSYPDQIIYPVLWT